MCGFMILYGNFIIKSGMAKKFYIKNNCLTVQGIDVSLRNFLILKISYFMTSFTCLCMRRRTEVRLYVVKIAFVLQFCYQVTTQCIRTNEVVKLAL